MLHHKSPQLKIVSCTNIPIIIFITQPCCPTSQPAHMFNSLVRVSRRDERHYAVSNKCIDKKRWNMWAFEKLTENPPLLLSIQINVNIMASVTGCHSIRLHLLVHENLSTCCTWYWYHVQPTPLRPSIQQVQMSPTPFSKLCLTFPTWYLSAISLR